MLALGAHNFAQATDRFVLMLVVFHVPGCDSCAALKQEYLEASDVLYEYLIPVAKVRRRRFSTNVRRRLYTKVRRRLYTKVRRRFSANIMRRFSTRVRRHFSKLRRRCSTKIMMNFSTKERRRFSTGRGSGQSIGQSFSHRGKVNEERAGYCCSDKGEGLI